MRLLDINITAHYQWTSWFGIELVAPYRLIETDASFLGNDMEPVPDSSGDIHHRDEVIQGLADIQIIGSAQIPSLRELLNTHLSFQLGFSVPTAQTEPNPFVLGELGLKHQHVFFGTGTYDPIFGAAFRSVLSNFDIIGWVRTKSPLVENSRGYQGPTITSGGLGIKSSFGLKSLSFVFQQEIQKESPARWRTTNGTVENARNSGRTDFMATAGMFWDISETVDLYALVKLPYWTQAQGGRMEIPAYASIGFQWGTHFDQENEATTHAHKHLSKAKGPGDIQDLATGGASFDLSKAAAAGKLTIIDFWANWCEPCHIIGELLHEVATHHENIAIRKVEVPNFDAPVFQEHLQGTPGLPIVWVLNESGEVVVKLEAVSPEAVAEKLESLIKCASPKALKESTP